MKISFRIKQGNNRKPNQQTTTKKPTVFHSKHKSSRNNIFSFKKTNHPTWVLLTCFFCFFFYRVRESLQVCIQIHKHIGYLTKSPFNLFKIKYCVAEWQILCKGGGMSLTRSSGALNVLQTCVLECAWKSLWLSLMATVVLCFSSHSIKWELSLISARYLFIVEKYFF